MGWLSRRLGRMGVNLMRVRVYRWRWRSIIRSRIRVHRVTLGWRVCGVRRHWQGSITPGMSRLVAITDNTPSDAVKTRRNGRYLIWLVGRGGVSVAGIAYWGGGVWWLW